MALAGICRTTRVLRFFTFSPNFVSFLTETSPKNVQNLFLANSIDCKYFCMEKKPGASDKPGDPKTGEKAKKRVGLTSPQITLVSSENEVQAMTLEQAEKISKRRNLKLVKIVDFDTKTEKPVYKLMTALEFFQEDSKMKERKRKEKETSIKESKLFTISAKIADHDLESKVRHMFKLLKKKHGVRIYISKDGNPTRAEEINKLIEEELKEISHPPEVSTKGNTMRLKFKPKLETEGSTSEADAESKKKVEESGVNKTKAATINENK